MTESSMINDDGGAMAALDTTEIRWQNITNITSHKVRGSDF